LGTLHATDAAQAVERIIDPFPAEQQQQIRLQLSQVIEAVLWQTLVPYADGTGRVAVFEILTATAAVRSLIRDGKTSELKTVMQMSSGDGMQTLDQALAKLVRARKITLQDAEARSSNPKQLNKLFQYECSGDKNYAGPSPADIQPRRMANTIA
jgi:twitching motility protein PilT